MRKVLYFILVGFILLLEPSMYVSALTPEQKRVIDSGALYFNTETDVCSIPRSTQTPTAPLGEGGNRAYNGEVVVNEAQLEAIRANQPFYESAAQKENIPWQMIAVVHILESGLKRENPANGQGAYQLYSYSGGGSGPNAFRPTGPISDEEFQRQTDITAGIIRGMSEGIHQANKPLELDSPTIGAVGDTFFSYNGRAGVYKDQAAALGYDRESEGYHGSPYVMNKFDAARDPNTAAPGTWGQIKTDGGSLSYPTNQHFGAWTIFSVLTGITGGGGACGGSGFSGPLVERLVQIAEAEFIAGAGRDMEADKSYHKYSMGRSEAWCAHFVSWVFNEAGSPFTGGWPEDWQYPGVSTMRAWYQENGEYSPRDGYIPRVGDVVFYEEDQMPYPNHVNLVVAVNETERTFTTIGGNETNGIRKSEQSFDASYVTGFGTRTE